MGEEGKERREEGKGEEERGGIIIMICYKNMYTQYSQYLER